MAAAHRRRSSKKARWQRYGGAAGFAAAAAVCIIVVNQTSGGATVHRIAGGDQTIGASSGHGDPTGSESVKALLAQLTVAPANGAAAVSPDTPVTVSTKKGRLTSVSVSTGSSPGLTGNLSPDGRSWTATQGLVGASAYQISVDVVSGDTRATLVTNFQTMAVNANVSTTFEPTDNSTVGVGQPVILHFADDVPAAAQASLIAHLSVAESTPVATGWHWFSPTELHLRPQTFWPAGEKITVTANLDGWNLGNGDWGHGTVVDHVTIGDSHVSVANLQTEVMTVYNNGQIVDTFPISGGSSEYPTQDGIHIALDKEPVVHMVSGTVGIPTTGPGGYDEYVYNDVHISDSGEYVHAAPWSVYAQGRENVSHGCINLSYANSKTFYNFANVGDVIEVTGGTRAPEAGDHGVMDWTLDWTQWTPATVTQA